MGPQLVISNHTPPHCIKDLPQTFIGWLFNFNFAVHETCQSMGCDKIWSQTLV